MIPIYLSTGCYNKKEKTIEDMILRAASASHKIQGVELSFLDPCELEYFNYSDKTDNALKKMKCTLHMPTKNIIYENNEECKKLIDKAIDVYDHFKCEVAVFHYQNVESFDYLISRFGKRKMLIENKDQISAKDCIAEMKPLFESYPDLGMVIDFEHAKYGAQQIIKEFEEKICEVHWSSPKISINHNSYNTILRSFDNNIAFARRLNKPVVIEIDLRSEDELENEYLEISEFVIRKEIGLLDYHLNRY
ncbi:MAG: hypothetical protein PHN56_03730 [Candidatus Nanoarchaeia archaeon]|nr:hypothetical protein [Candidatus Nanoarchaeia archaeon]